MPLAQCPTHHNPHALARCPTCCDALAWRPTLARCPTHSMPLPGALLVATPLPGALLNATPLPGALLAAMPLPGTLLTALARRPPHHDALAWHPTLTRRPTQQKALA
jgi:hypothetical protein